MGEYWRYEYDVFNRLVKANKSETGKANAQTVAEYVYDGENLRIRKDSVKEGTTWYVFGLSGEILREETAKETSEYVYVSGKLYAVNITKTGQATERFYFVTDHLGTTELLMDENGEVVWQEELSPFGERNGEVGTKHWLARFTGKGLDAETGLWYFNARWMDPATGRFTSQDPMMDGANWYGYVNNNPLMFTDPTGLTPSTEMAEKLQADYEAQKKSTSVQINGTLSNAPPRAPQVLQDIDKWVTRTGARVWNFFGAGIQPDDSLLTMEGQWNSWFGGIPYRVPMTEFGYWPASQELQDQTIIMATVAFSEAGLLRAATVGTAASSTAGAQLADDAAKGTFSWNGKSLTQLAEQNLTSNGKAVLGTWRNGGPGDYIVKAKSMDASYFDVGPDAWKAMTATEQRAANQHFLDVITAREDQVFLSVPKTQIPSGGSLSWEIEYLTGTKGYQWVNQWSLIPGK